MSEPNEIPEPPFGEQNSASKLAEALVRLPLFDDLFLGMQARNVAMVDGFLEDLESQILREHLDLERTPVSSLLFLGALSQMWVFAVYELLRTWRQWCRELIDFAARLEQLPESERSLAIQRELSLHGGKIDTKALSLSSYRSSFSKVASTNFVSDIQAAFNRIESVFRVVEALRVTLAKHEVPKTKGQRSFAPGYARQDMSDGSLTWPVELKDGSLTMISRRLIADTLRNL